MVEPPKHLSRTEIHALEAIERYWGLTQAQKDVAFNVLIPEGYIDATSTWRLTPKGHRALEAAQARGETIWPRHSPPIAEEEKSMERKPRKQIEDIIEELRSWLPNYDRGPNDYPAFLFRILASMPGGDELEDMGYETFPLGWHELDQLGRMIDAIQDKRDVEDLAHGLTYEEEEDLDEAQRRPQPPEAHAPAHRPAWPTAAAPRKKAPRRKKTTTRKKTPTRRRR